MKLNEVLIKLVFYISLIIGLPAVLITGLLLLIVWLIFSSVVYINNNISQHLSKYNDEYDCSFIKFNDFVELFKTWS